jgi:4-amino-4-deoxychorismate lyase
LIASLINGEERDHLFVLDRGLQFGDGLFETIAVVEGRPALWHRHMKRLLQGCRQLGIPAPDPGLLFDEARKLIGERSTAVLKLLLTRGRSERGYRSPGKAASPTRILELFEWEGPNEPFREIPLRICRQRLGIQPGLGGLKHLNRLEQVLARSEFEAGEGVMLDVEGFLVEATASNLFLLVEGQLHTPLIDRCGVAGVVRELVLDTAREQHQPVTVRRILPGELEEAEGVFLTSSLLGVAVAGTIEGTGKKVWGRHHPVMETVASRVFGS